MTPTVFPTIDDVLATQADRSAEAVALLAPGRTPLSYGELRRQAQAVTARLRSWGIGRNDRVAVVLPDGPEMAVAFLSIASGATFAPLNPAYRAAEFEFYLSDLKPKVVILGADEETAAVEVAQRLGIPRVRLTPLAAGPTGLFNLSGEVETSSTAASPVAPEDVALMVHTSGTTGRPKIVPLSHRNLCTSAANICRTLRLTEDDRGISVMPMFHVHALLSSILVPLASGGSVVCPVGLSAPYFLEWLETFRPTWYTAAPAIHQAILARAPENPRAAAGSSLRFIRCGAAPLSLKLLRDLEQAFGVPLIEYYGTSEAAQQVTSNPLPPGLRKPGSVGPAAGPEAAIMAEDRPDLLPAGQIGEVVVRGASVISGYADNPEANARAFFDGWFRTGDQGYMDADGYFYITGRLKEVINRGGEKFSPREVDEALLEHPAVVEAAAFAVPDAVLGEDVAAAVVLRDPSVSERDLRRFVALRVADFKVPRQIAIVKEIPRTAVGKVQRDALAAALGPRAERREVATGPGRLVAPRTALEEHLAVIWREVLRVPAVGVNESFLELGGDSITAAQLLARFRRLLGVEMTLFDLLECRTVAGLAEWMERFASGAAEVAGSAGGVPGEREELDI